MEFGFTEEQVLLRDSVRRLMERHAPPEEVRRLDREREYPDALYHRWAEAGLLALPFAESEGGLGGSAVDLTIVAEEISRASADLFMAYAGSVFCGLNVARKGSPEQKARWLPRVISGETRFAIGISEPDAGSDVGAMRTTARQEGDAWVIEGQKLWTTGAAAPGGVLNLYVRTQPGDHRKGLSLFLVDHDAPGVRLRKLDMLGRRSTGTYEVFLDSVRVPQDRLVGGLHQGWDCLLSGLQIERAVSAAGNCGAAQACFDLALSYAKERVQFGRPIGTFQALAHELANMQTEIEAARLLTWRAAWMVAEGRDALREITMAKLASSEAYARVANLGMQVMGGYGFNMEFDMQRHYRDARSATVAAGSSQMQRDLLAGLMGIRPR
ncbi:acyl-CoA/acyl-ACP dehydrogenase [Roseomonas sp. OT10]|uniref:acyl-CoA dehydrogenase family protein n=1 Tax=Roseomonas cutis TaxID=2897332 RepID=UPI001E444618|nr:acyl-CoA dehydrogenase family protein [Roseomonas sp. OT10]UFN49478.1 acyl-CoA/acyl-ACP dehydrogenase [Roseomonas sp. OT10]